MLIFFKPSVLKITFSTSPSSEFERTLIQSKRRSTPRWSIIAFYNVISSPYRFSGGIILQISSSSQLCILTFHFMYLMKLRPMKKRTLCNGSRVAVKCIAYEFHEENLLAPKSKLLLETNPVHKKIPVLIHNNKPISESQVTVEYLDKLFTYSRSILPSDPYGCDITRFWDAYVDSELFKMMLVTVKIGFEGIIVALDMLEGAFVKISDGKVFFGGGKFGFLDIVLGSQLGWIKVIEKATETAFIDGSKTPELYGWAWRFFSNDVVKDLSLRMTSSWNLLLLHFST